MTQETLSFEKAFERLEKILETMNNGKTPLAESLKLYEEAEQLLRLCNHTLSSAEQKIETLIKGRAGDLVMDRENRPKTEPLAYG